MNPWVREKELKIPRKWASELLAFLASDRPRAFPLNAFPLSFAFLLSFKQAPDYEVKTSYSLDKKSFKFPKF